MLSSDFNSEVRTIERKIVEEMIKRVGGYRKNDWDMRMMNMWQRQILISVLTCTRGKCSIKGKKKAELLGGKQKKEKAEHESRRISVVKSKSWFGI